MRAYYFDDSGDRSPDNRPPFFVMGGFGIDADQLPELQARTRKVAATFGLTLKHPVELKFNHVGRNEGDVESKPH